jgi:1,4-dihydroxy-2-naphthoyl-CoA hydrolase
MIWFNKSLRLEEVQSLGQGTMGDYIGIEWVEIGTDFLRARMPVDHRTNQPYGLLHGGASVVLAETIGSIGSALVVDHTKFYCVGLEVNANHIRGARSGFVTGTGAPLHLGKSTHVWEIKIIDEQEKLICVSRLTVAIIPRK